MEGRLGSFALRHLVLDRRQLALQLGVVGLVIVGHGSARFVRGRARCRLRAGNRKCAERDSQSEPAIQDVFHPCSVIGEPASIYTADARFWFANRTALWRCIELQRDEAGLGLEALEL